MAISNLVLTQQIYSEETNGAHAHYREPVPLTKNNVNYEWTYASKLYTWYQKYEIAVAIAPKWATVI